MLASTGSDEIFVAYVTRVLIKRSTNRNALYMVALADRFVMVLMVFQQLLHSNDGSIKLNIPIFKLRKRGSVYKNVLLPLSDAVVRTVSKTGVHNTFAKTHFSPVVVHAVVLRSL